MMVLEVINGELCFNEQLLLHIERKNNDEVRSILINDDACKASDSNGMTLLHFASQYGNPEIVKHLIDSGVNVNAQDILDRTPLLLALLSVGIHSGKEDTLETAEILLKANADFLKTDNCDRNPLQLVINNDLGKGEIRKMFIDRLKEYCVNDISMIADLLMKAGCSIEGAVSLRNSTITEMMFEAGCSMNAGDVALHLAAQNMDVENVKVLIKYGADVTAKIGEAFNMPLTAYLVSGARYPRKRNREVMKLLMREYFADPDKAFDTMVSLEDILELGDEQDIRYMLHQYDIDFSTTDPNGNGVLHYLAGNLNPNVTKPFEDIIGQMDVNIRNHDKLSPLYQASLTNNPSTVQFLLDNGAEVDAIAGPGATPLVAAICRTTNCASKKRKADKRKIVEILLRHGADVQVMWGISSLNTLFDVVAEKSRFDLGELLMARLVFLEKLGKPIVDSIRSKIDAHRRLKNQYDSYKRQLDKMEKTDIYGSITLFNLMIKSEEEIARCYVYNSQLLKKLKKFDFNYHSSSYYYDTLRLRISSALKKIKLIHDATEVLFSQVAPQLNGNYLVVRNIIDNLEYEDMKALNQI